MAAVGERLRQIREEHDLSLDEFAKLFDTYRATIWRYEQGKRKPQIDFMIAVAQYFGVSIDWLAGISDVKKLQVNLSLDKILTSLPENKKSELLNYAKYLKRAEEGDKYGDDK